MRARFDTRTARSQSKEMMSKLFLTYGAVQPSLKGGVVENRLERGRDGSVDSRRSLKDWQVEPGLAPSLAIDEAIGLLGKRGGQNGSSRRLFWGQRRRP